MKILSVCFALAVVFVLASAFASAIVVREVQAPTLLPGKESSVIVTIKNTLDDDAEDVSFGFVLSGTQFIASGGSEDSTDEIRDSDDEDFSFRIKPSFDVKPGDYLLPYELSYTFNGDRVTKKGTIGVHVGGSPELRATVEGTTPVLGSTDTVTVRIINDGLADARFVSVSIIGEGMTLLSDGEVYIGTIDSDDFETATFDVMYTRERANVVTTISYRDLDNNRLTEEVRLPLSVYTREEAISRGIITQSYTLYYVVIAVVVIVLWFIWRAIRKRRRARLNARA